MARYLDLSQFLALPMHPCIRVHVGAHDVIEVDQVAWEAHKEEFKAWALELPGIDQGIGYRLLKPYTEGNGMLAKLTVALGDLAGIWTMYPKHFHAAAQWGRTHPMIIPIDRPVKRKIPKPSAGDLDPTATCTCCERGMGPPESQVHDLTASDDYPGICIECDFSCGVDAKDCALTRARPAKKKTAAKRAPAPAPDSNVVDFSGALFDDYARQFGSD
jgi:hypothetical protein